MREALGGEKKEEREVIRMLRGRFSITSEQAMTRVVWEQGYTLCSFCRVQCCDTNFFDLPNFFSNKVCHSGQGGEHGFYLLACLMSFVFSCENDRKHHFHLWIDLAQNRKGHIGDYDLICTYN